MYKNIGVLGRGSYGLVYKAENIDKCGEFVAIKKYINISKSDIPYQILREINIIKLLKHPNIIGIQGINSLGNEIELILEYGGESLRKYYNRIPYIQRTLELKNITYQILMGCLYMHKLGVIHRDLKPDNILINGNRIKICDFGLAKKLPPFKNDYNSYQICTLCYRPPELFTVDNQNYGTSIDVWSLGCLLYEFIIKKPLFEGTTEMVVLKNILCKVPSTQEDLDNLNLNQWKLESCNTEKYYKFPPLYDISSDNDEMIINLENFKCLVQTMLTLDPNKRITLEEAYLHKFFTGIEETSEELISYLKLNKINYYQNFIVRSKLPKQISEDMRKVYVEYIFNWIEIYPINEQSIMIAINIFDQFICLKRSNRIITEEILCNLGVIAACCLMLASKYIDLSPIDMKKLSVKYPKTKLINWERNIVQSIDFDLNQPTLLDLYKEITETDKKFTIPFNHWIIIKKIISNYSQLIDRGVQELKEYLYFQIKNS